MRFLIISLIIFCLSSFMLPDAGDSIIGEWVSVNTDGDQGIVKVYRAQNGKYYGKLVEASDVEFDNKIKNNKDPLFILKSFEYESNNIWDNGVVIRPKFGDKYRGRLVLKDENTLVVIGYLSVFSKSVEWTRKKK